MFLLSIHTVALDPTANRPYYFQGQHSTYDFPGQPPAPSPVQAMPELPCLFVGNVPPNTPDDMFVNLFRQQQAVGAFIVRESSGKSREYGFAYFLTEGSRNAALKRSLELLGKKLSLALPAPSKAKSSQTPKQPSQKQQTTNNNQNPSHAAVDVELYDRYITVSNVPRTANEEDVRNAFLQYNPVNVVLPRNGNSSVHLGHAFVEFADATQRNLIVYSLKQVIIQNNVCQIRKRKKAQQQRTSASSSSTPTQTPSMTVIPPYLPMKPNCTPPDPILSTIPRNNNELTLLPPGLPKPPTLGGIPTPQFP